jgi:hypothetical protein
MKLSDVERVGRPAARLRILTLKINDAQGVSLSIRVGFGGGVNDLALSPKATYGSYESAPGECVASRYLVSALQMLKAGLVKEKAVLEDELRDMGVVIEP